MADTVLTKTGLFAHLPTDPPVKSWGWRRTLCGVEVDPKREPVPLASLVLCQQCQRVREAQNAKPDQA